MKNIVILFIFLILVISCDTSKKFGQKNRIATKVNDTIRITNDSLEYEVVIIDPGFNSWLNSMAHPRQFYTQNYMEVRNRFWVQQWNNRVLSATINNAQLYEMTIDFQSNINYGYEVNYMLFNYLTYFQIRNRQQLGGFTARF